MSSYPSQGAPRNPDNRALPPGWVEQYDPNYRAWFYVNTTASPPVTTWTHPLGPAPPPPAAYSAPSHPPPVDNYRADYNPNSGPNNSWDNGPPAYSSYPNNYPQQPQQPQQPQGYASYGGGNQYGQQNGPPGWQSGPPPSGGSNSGKGWINAQLLLPYRSPLDTGILGGLFGGKTNHGQQQQMQAGPPPTVIYQQAAPKKSSGFSGSSALMGAGAGILGGLLVADLVEDAVDDNYYDGGGDFGDGGFF
ncbi:hypothetical protein BDN72DRAFT_881243 [Pluteus cervinus]|uniref:Uncharacterized protein n=1 Tax=Pluteus cervinus TaxID=181527 RepID=A0ACD3AGT4_9AGAR|nr:hypothetical protein BDN72DRAFT_881243 [Pluteus cervinus]